MPTPMADVVDAVAQMPAPHRTARNYCSNDELGALPGCAPRGVAVASISRSALRSTQPWRSSISPLCVDPAQRLGKPRRNTPVPAAFSQPPASIMASSAFAISGDLSAWRCTTFHWPSSLRSTLVQAITPPPHAGAALKVVRACAFAVDEHLHAEHLATASIAASEDGGSLPRRPDRIPAERPVVDGVPRAGFVDGVPGARHSIEASARDHVLDGFVELGGSGS